MIHTTKLAACAVLLAALLPAQQPADLILHGGRIATLSHDEGFVEALAIRDGRVHAVGPTDTVMRFRGDATRVVDVGGRTVIPGLNDSHLHVVRGGRFYNLELRWDGVRTLADALRMVREQAARTPPGQWVRVIGGWSPFQFAERRMPTVQELNDAAPETPVFVLFLYSRAFLNAAGVAALGLSEATEPPRGGRYEFVDGGAELIADPDPTILYKTIGALPHLSAADRVNSTRHFLRELNRFGLTSASDAGGGGHLFPDDYGAAAELARAGELSLRIAYYLFPQRPDRELEDFERWIAGETPGADGDRVHRGGYVLAGGGEFLTWSAGDFENFLAPRPAQRRAMDGQLLGVASLLVRERWPFRIHATYGESIDRILDVFEKVDALHPFDGLPFWVDHAETVRADQIQRIQRLGGGVAVQDRMAFAGEYFLERYGPEVTSHAPPLRQLLESGIPLAAGTDATRVSSHNPWLALSWMVTGRTVGGTVIYPESNRLTRLEALRLFTVGSARVSGEQDVKGTLRPGQLADLAVLSDDYFGCDEERIGAIEAVLTLVAGEPVYGAGPFASLDPQLPAVSPAWSPVAHYGGYQRASR